MKETLFHHCLVVASAALMLAALSRPAAAAEMTAAQRGEYVFRAADCEGCHTAVKPKGKLLAGGRPLVTQFGTFYPPNITPDPRYGIGNWTFSQFARALRDGEGSGTVLYPAFPYPSYTGMTDADLHDLWAYLRTVPPVAEPSRNHDLNFPYNIRLLTWPWRWLFFKEGGEPIDKSRPAIWQRGAYLVRSLGHCGECHTPRNFLGGVDNSRELGGNPDGPEGKHVPNITPDPKKGIGDWSVDDIAAYLESGITPDNDFAGGPMAEVIENSTSKLTDEDRKAIATYVKSVPPVGGP